MRRDRSFRIALTAGVGWMMVSLAPAHAVVPGLFQPLQQLLSVLPAFFAMAAAVVLLWFGSVRRLLGRAVRVVTSRPKVLAAFFVVLALGVPAAYFAFSGRGATAQAQNVSTNTQWPCFRGSLARTGWADSVAPPTKPAVAWKFRELVPTRRELFTSSPAVADGKVFAGSWGGQLYCFDAASGHVLWTFENDATIAIHSSPAVSDGRVYVGEGLHMDSDTSLYCIDVATGRKLWQFQTGSHVESSPFIADAKAYVGAGFDGVYCIDAGTGEEVWHFPDHHVDASPAVADGVCFFGSGGAGMDEEEESLFAVDAATGKELWRLDYDYPVWGAPAVVDGRVYVGMGNGNVDLSDDEPYGAVECLEAATGNSLWKHELPDSVLGATAVVDGRVYCGSRDGKLYCLDAGDGDEVFHYATSPDDDPMAIVSSPAVAAGQVIFGCEDGKLRSVNAQTGALNWEFDAGFLDTLALTDSRIIPSPAVAGGHVYCAADNFFVFCLGNAP